MVMECGCAAGWAGLACRSEVMVCGQNRDVRTELPGPERGSAHPGEKDCLWSQSQRPSAVWWLA